MGMSDKKTVVVGGANGGKLVPEPVRLLMMWNARAISRGATVANLST